MSTREGLREAVRELLLGKGDTEPFRDDEQLLTGGRLESIAVVELITHMEERYGVDFSARDFDPDDFDSIDTMAALVGDGAA